MSALVSDQLHVGTCWQHWGHWANTSALSSAGPIYFALDKTPGELAPLMATSQEMSATKARELGHKCSHEYLAKSYSESFPSNISFTAGVPLSRPNGSPKTRLGIPYGIVVYQSSQLCLSWFGLCYPRISWWQTGFDNGKMFICCLIHCWSIAKRCSCTARTGDIGCWSAYFLSEVRFWKIAMIKLF